MLDHQNRVADILECLRVAAAGEEIAWSISNALDRMRYGFGAPLSNADREDILAAIVRAHGTALAERVLSPLQLALGFSAMSAQVIAARSELDQLGVRCPPHSAFGLPRDIHDRVRIFQSELDIIAREHDIGVRAESRRVFPESGFGPARGPRMFPSALQLSDGSVATAADHENTSCETGE